MIESGQEKSNPTEHDVALDLYERVVKEVFFEYGMDAVVPLLDEIVSNLSKDPSLQDELSGGVELTHLLYLKTGGHPKVVTNEVMLVAMRAVFSVLGGKSSATSEAAYAPALDRIFLNKGNTQEPLSIILTLMTQGTLPHSGSLWHEFIHSFQNEGSFFNKAYLVLAVLNVFPFLFFTEPYVAKIIAFIDVVFTFFVFYEKRIKFMYHGSLHFSEMHAYIAGDSIMACPDIPMLVDHILELYGPILDEQNTRGRLQKAADCIVSLRALGISHAEIAKLSADENGDTKLEEFLKEVMLDQGVDTEQLEEKVTHYLKQREQSPITIRTQVTEKVRQFLEGFNSGEKMRQT